MAQTPEQIAELIGAGFTCMREGWNPILSKAKINWALVYPNNVGGAAGRT